MLLNAGSEALFVVKGPMLGQVRRRPGPEPPTARRGEAIGRRVGAAGSMQRKQHGARGVAPSRAREGDSGAGGESECRNHADAVLAAEAARTTATTRQR